MTYIFPVTGYMQIEKEFGHIDPPDQARRILAIVQFNLSAIHIDIQDRKNKYPSQICFFVQVPKDIRLLYKSESPYFDSQGCYHEMGHAPHAYSINPQAGYWNRYTFPWA